MYLSVLRLILMHQLLLFPTETFLFGIRLSLLSNDPCNPVLLQYTFNVNSLESSLRSSSFVKISARFVYYYFDLGPLLLILRHFLSPQSLTRYPAQNHDTVALHRAPVDISHLTREMHMLRVKRGVKVFKYSQVMRYHITRVTSS